MVLIIDMEIDMTNVANLADKYQAIKLEIEALERLLKDVKKENSRLRSENEKLRAILFQFAAYDDDYENDDSGSMTVITVPIGVIRAAAAALKETDND